MTDQIPADEVRKIIAAHRDGASGKGGLILAALQALLPAPKRPTLADMTRGERAACQWMQVHTPPRFRAVILATDLSGERAALLDRWGDTIYMNHEDVTPRPDLPRLEWPGNQKPAPALPDGWRLADHKDNGRIVVTNTNPNSDGRVYYVLPADTDHLGFDWLSCTPDRLTYLDTSQEAADAVD